MLGKWDQFYYIYDPIYDYPIRCTYREFVEYISEENVKFFFVNDIVDENYNLDLHLEEIVYGGSRQGKQERKNLKNGPGKTNLIAGSRRRKESNSPLKKRVRKRKLIQYSFLEDSDTEVLKNIC